MIGGILIFLLLVVTATIAPRVQPYYCRTEDRIREVENAKDTLKRVFQRENKLFLVVENRILFLETPFTQPVPGEAWPKLLQRNVLQVIRSEQNLGNFVPVGFRVMGYVHDDKTGSLFELYSTEGKKGVGQNEILDYAIELSFETGLPPGARVRRKEISDLWTYFWLKTPKPKKYTVSDVLTYSGPTKYIEIYDGDKSEGSNFFLTYSYKYLDLEFCYTLWNREHSSICHKFEEAQFKWMKSFAAYLQNITVDYKSGRIEFDLYIFGIEEDHAINFHKAHFLTTVEHNTMDDYWIIEQQNIRWSLDNLLSCHTPWRDRKDIKGVHYEKKSKIFYVFVKRFYLKIQNELVQNGFELDDSVYEHSAYDLLYPSDSVYAEFRWDMILAKYLKNLATKFYFMPNYNIYQLSLNDQDKFTIKLPPQEDLDKMAFLHDCSGQTMVIGKSEKDRHVYCFRGSTYVYLHHLGTEYTWVAERKKFSTHKIFEDLKIGYFFNQSLEFTFNYGENQIAFMTATDLWLFKYEGFRKEPDNSLIYLDKHVRMKNCFFAKCPSPDIPQTPPTTETTTLPTTKKRITKPRPIFTTPNDPMSRATTISKPSEKRLSDLYWFLIIIAILFLVAFLLYACYMMSRKGRSKSNPSLSRREVFMFRNLFRRKVKPASLRKLTLPSEATSSMKPVSTGSFALPSSKQLSSRASSASSSRRRTSPASRR